MDFFFFFSSSSSFFLDSSRHKSYSLIGKSTRDSKTKPIHNCLVDMYFVCAITLSKGDSTGASMVQKSKSEREREIMQPSMQQLKLIFPFIFQNELETIYVNQLCYPNCKTINNSSLLKFYEQSRGNPFQQI